MSNLLFAFLAASIASSITILELITTKYPRTFLLLKPWRCWALYAYSLLYGIPAFIIVASGILHFEGTSLSNPLLRAIFVGLTIKAFLHIRFFSVSAGDTAKSDPIPIGFETVIHMFEPALLRQIELDEYNNVRSFLAQRANLYPDPDYVRREIMQNLPRKLKKEDRISLEEDLKYALQEDADRDSKTRVIDAMEIYLERMDKKTLDRVFPPAGVRVLTPVRSRYESRMD